MNALEKAELAASIHHIVRFLKSGIPDTADRETRRRRTQANAKCFAFHANVMQIENALDK